MPDKRYQIHVGYNSFYQGPARSQSEWEASVRQLMDEGQAFLAHDLAQAGLKLYPDSLSLKQSMARALTKVGALDEARRLLEELARLAPDDETLGLLGSAYKSLWRRGDPTAAARSLAAYHRGFELSREIYTGINAASMSWMTGDRAGAAELAGQVRAICRARLNEGTRDYWAYVSLGEACLLLGQADEALAIYRQSAARLGGNYAHVVTALRQLRLLAAHGLAVPPALFDLLRPPTVVAFSGHLLDRPGRPAPRFPSGREIEVRGAIDAELDRLDARIGYSSAGCGADLLFIEAMQEREAEVNIVLPFDQDDFIETSVAYAGPRWVARFRRALKLAHSVKYVTEERYLGDDLLFVFTNQIFCSYASLRAQALDTEPHLLAVWDGTQTGLAGGTGDIVRRWPDPGRLHVISMPGSEASAEPAEASPGPAHPREIHSLLFADVVGYSSLQEHDLPVYLYEFLARVSRRLRQLPAQPEFVNTWGDALFAVMPAARPMVDYALALHAAVDQANAEIDGLPRPLSVRVGLHAGPVYPGADPFTGQPNFYGTHVNRTARLEPVTLPGHIYATEQFVALLDAECQAARDCPYLWEYVGMLALAKDFGSQAVYHVLKR